MTGLEYARAQMGISLAFHIVFAAAGVALPLFMVIADALWIRTRSAAYRELSHRLAAAAPGAPPGGKPSGPARASGDLATVVSGLASLTDGAARVMDAGNVKQSVVAMENGCLFVMAISDGSLLGVHATPECDMSVVAYHMALFVGRAGHVLTPELRSELSKARTATPAAASSESEH